MFNITWIMESFNYFEIGLWSIFGLALLFKSRALNQPLKNLAYISAIAFFAFAGSDYVEIQTGAWWRPWWLFAWKASCVITVLWCAWRYMCAKSSA